MRRSNYDKLPTVAVPSSDACQGWDAIAAALGDSDARCRVVECYHGVDHREVARALVPRLGIESVLVTTEAMLPPDRIDAMLGRELPESEPVFGVLTTRNLRSLFDPAALQALKAKARNATGPTLVIGPGASLVTHGDQLIYADMSRWEIQQRFRQGVLGNLGADNTSADFWPKYKRGYFVDWRLCDKLKKSVMPQADFILDTHLIDQPKLISQAAFRAGLSHTAHRPFRVVPYFDPGPWGGQWMKEVCDLDRSQANFAWCFDCVPEENSLRLEFNDVVVELPSQDLVLFEPRALLGEAVHARFGAEFPIRFDFLDTMGGGNLSLQVHPLTEYIQEHFGMHYTQDESYYLLDAEPGARVYLGLKEGIDPDAMLAALHDAQVNNAPFDADAFVQSWPAEKHDHFLIPAGTVHASGAGGMVLEISSTPYIFTFKLWDWKRLGLDGKPRPISLDHGEQVIQWDRTTEWTRRNLVRQVTTVAESEGIREERTGLHEREFIETRRHWFTRPVDHHTRDGVNVLNLVQGNAAMVESPSAAFEPFEVHYAETFIVPAAVGPYRIRPLGNEECATVKAFVRT